MTHKKVSEELPLDRRNAGGRLGEQAAWKCYPIFQVKKS